MFRRQLWARPRPCETPGSTVPLLWTLFLATAGLLSAQPNAAPPAKAVAQQEVKLAIGATVSECAKCHEQVVHEFPLGIHGKSAQFLNGAQSAKCEACHGDGTRHNISGRPRDIQTPNKMPADQANQLCLTCHSSDQTHFGWRGSAHERKDMSCVSCHNEHSPKSADKLLSKVSAQELCLSCHKEKRKAMLQRSTHLFRTEHNDVKLGCTSCHNPHGGEGRTMLQASSTTQLCFTCHAEKRGPFLWEHAPVRENCDTCHIPHGSNNPNLLKARTSVMCQQCHMHMLWRHQTIAGFDIFSFNNGCTNCHSQIHGSNHPSGRAFTH